MRSNHVMYANLRAEMSRKNIGVLYMAQKLGCNRDTLSRKLSGKSSISLEEAFNIQREFFPDLDIRYLFAMDTGRNTA